MNICKFGCLYNFFFAGAGFSISDVITNGTPEHINILLNNANCFSQRFLRDISYVSAVNGNTAFTYVVETRKKRAYRRLSASRRTDQSNGFSGRNFKVDVIQYIMYAVIGEKDVLILNCPFYIIQIRSIWLIFDFNGGFHNFQKTRKACHAFLEYFHKVDQNGDRIDKNIDI